VMNCSMFKRRISATPPFWRYRVEDIFGSWHLAHLHPGTSADKR